jgi:hypothetical protein
MTRGCPWLRPLVLAITLLLTQVTPTPGQTYAQSQPVTGWVSLGPSQSIEAYGVGVSSEWPDDPFIIARTRPTFDRATNKDVPPDPPAVRSFDGGQTWEPLTQSPSTGRLSVIQTKQGRVILSLPETYTFSTDPQNRPRQVSRTVDDGLTWNPILTVATRDAPELFLSPAIADDGRLYLRDGATLYESVDFGATWTPRIPVEGQGVQAIVFSPTFSQDRTLFASVTTSGFRLQGDDSGTRPSIDSAGVLVSRDAGLNWTSVSDGLQIDGVPYRHVQALAISPSFAQDRTLLAYAWGPLELFEVGAPNWKHTTLFRSQDAGATWQVIWQPEYRPQPRPGGYISYRWLTIVPFPTFGDDGRIAAAVQSGGGSPSSGGCKIMLSSDRGSTWRTFDDPILSLHLRSCLKVAPRRGTFTSLVSGGIVSGSSSGIIGVTEETTSLLHPPSPWFAPAGIVGPTMAGDGSIFLGTQDGIWMLPPDAPFSP